MYESKRQYQYGTGRRKSSIARVRLYQGGTGAALIQANAGDGGFATAGAVLILSLALVHSLLPPD